MLIIVRSAYLVPACILVEGEGPHLNRRHAAYSSEGSSELEEEGVRDRREEVRK